MCLQRGTNWIYRAKPGNRNGSQDSKLSLHASDAALLISILKLILWLEETKCEDNYIFD